MQHDPLATSHSSQGTQTEQRLSLEGIEKKGPVTSLFFNTITPYFLLLLHYDFPFSTFREM